MNNKGTTQLYYGANEEELDLEDASLAADKERELKRRKGINWKDALEQNKTSSKCVICGKPTQERALLFSTYMYCPCVEETT